MRIPFLGLFQESPFGRLIEHAEKVKEGGRQFREAMVCYLQGHRADFDRRHLDVTRLESDADAIKRNIRGHLPSGIMMPVNKFLFLYYLRNQDNVIDAAQDTLHWLSYQSTLIPDALGDDFLYLVDKAVEVIDLVPQMAKRGTVYFRSFSTQDRERAKETIRTIRQKENESDQIERKLMSDIFAQTVSDPAATFPLIHLVECIGEISNHAENASDMMRVMIAR